MLKLMSFFNFRSEFLNRKINVNIKVDIIILMYLYLVSFYRKGTYCPWLLFMCRARVIESDIDIFLNFFAVASMYCRYYFQEPEKNKKNLILSPRMKIG
jgi:hypothetical protein